MNKAVFLDRDGTINVDKEYLYKIEDFEFLPGALEGLQILQNAGYILIIITNQSGIARGYYKESDFERLNKWMIKELYSRGIKLSGVYHCPHHPQAKIERLRIDCDCRKPKLGLFKKAVEDYDLDIDSCFAIGDKIRDCNICERTNCHGFLIGNNEKPDIIESVKNGAYMNIKYAENLLQASQFINANSNRS